MNPMNRAQNLSAVALSANASQASTVTGSAVDLATYEGEAVILQSAAAGGTGSLDGKIQDSADGSTDWQDVSGATFTQVTADASLQKLNFNTDSCRRYIRYVGTIVTGPQVVSATLLAAKKYGP